MAKALRPFALTVLATWTLLAFIAAYYSHQQHIPLGRVLVVLPAFFLESALYLCVGFEAPRQRIAHLGSRPVVAGFLWVSGLLPHLAYTIPAGVFSLVHFGWLALLTGVLCFWFVAFPRLPAADLFFLILVASVFLAKLFRQWYPSVWPHVRLDILGQIMWMRLGILSVLLLRPLGNVRLGFAPTRREWRIGILCYLGFLPFGYLLVRYFAFARFQLVSSNYWLVAGLAAATFAGVLWVLALWEEFLCRGYLQQVLTQWFRSPSVGLVLASVIFGLAHLLFRRFPNWHMVALATVAGLFYGLAYWRSGSVRSSMVTHALVVTTWRIFFAA